MQRKESKFKIKKSSHSKGKSKVTESEDFKKQTKMMLHEVKNESETFGYSEF